jgi:hypothetical protein
VNPTTVTIQGNVGIGTTGPNAKLDVAGKILAAEGGGTNGGYTFENDGGYDTGMFSPSDGITDFYNNGVHTINVTSGGAKFYQGITFPDGTTQTTAASGSSVVNAGNISSGQFGSNTGGGTYAFSGNVGIGTTAPASRLSVIGGGTPAAGFGVNNGDVWTNIYNDAANGSNSGVIQVTAGGSATAIGASKYNLALNPYGGNVGIGLTNPQNKLDVLGGVAIGGYAGNVAPTNGLMVSGNVGIGTTAPGAKLDVEGGDIIASGNIIAKGGCIAANAGYSCAGNTFYVVGTGAVTGNFSIGGKLTVPTIDPLYTINGTNYSTYAPSMTGVNEETAGTVELQRNAAGTYSATMDFAGATKGSDLWLFAQATNLKNTMSQLVVSLTPSFDGNVWYTKNATADAVTIHGSTAGEVSYNLTAPRFDAAQWPNIAPADEASKTGLIIND